MKNDLRDPAVVGAPSRGVHIVAADQVGPGSRRELGADNGQARGRTSGCSGVREDIGGYRARVRYIFDVSGSYATIDSVTERLACVCGFAATPMDFSAL